MGSNVTVKVSSAEKKRRGERCGPPSIPIDQESMAVLKENHKMRRSLKVNAGLILNIWWLSDSMP